MKKLTLLSLFFLFTITLPAQLDEDIPEMITDRPDQTESAYIVPQGFYQLEAGILCDRFSKNNRVLSAPTALLRIGLFSHAELRIGTDMLIERDGLQQKGLSPLSIGAKTLINEGEGWKPRIAVIAALTIPETGKSAFKQEHLTPELLFAFENVLNDRLSIGYNAGFIWEDYYYRTLTYYSLVAGIGLTDKLNTFVEWYGFYAPNLNGDNRIDGGFTYSVRHNLQVDISFGMGLSDISPEGLLGLGVSWRIPE